MLVVAIAPHVIIAVAINNVTRATGANNAPPLLPLLLLLPTTVIQLMMQ
jgi:hypothetical protein